jgi:transcriptional regulator with XRE-family HTH domain
MDNDKMVERLKEIIRVRGITQTVLAETADISFVTLSRLLNKKLKLNSVETLHKLAKALNVPVGYFFGETEMGVQSFDLPDAASIPEPVIHWGASPPELKKSQDFVFIPVFETRAAATPAIVEISHENIEGWTCIQSSRFRRAASGFHAFRVRGDSMMPFINENDVVVVQPYDFSPDYLQHDKIYLIHAVDDNGNAGLMLKKVYMHEQNLVLISLNSEYSPLFIDLRKLNHNPVKGILRWVWREF